MLSNFVIVFDLDDTLYYEIDYLISAYKEIAKELANKSKTLVSKEIIFIEMFNLYKNSKNVFSEILEIYDNTYYSKDDLIALYRNHSPQISLTDNSKNLLIFLKDNNIDTHLITDGRSKQQRSKIKALKIESFLKLIIISEEFGSEKPNINNFLSIENKYKKNNKLFVYIGDNINKDFISPNKLGWITIMLKDLGKNIHSQNISVNKIQQPKYTVNSLDEIQHILQKKAMLL